MTNPIPPSAGLRGAVDLSSLVQSPAPGADQAAAAGDALVFPTDDQAFAQTLELSRTVPVVIVLWASWSEQSAQVVDSLERLVRARAGRLVLATADADRSPQLVQALQAQSVPTVVALVAGQPVPLFQGVQPDDVIGQVFDQLLQLAEQHGVTGTVEAGEPGDPDASQEPAEAPLPPLHQEAYDAISQGDYTAAAAAYRTAIAQDPRDALAVAGLAQANLLGRLQGKSLDEIRNAAAADPGSLEAQLDVADLDLSGGHVDDAFTRLLDLFPTLDADGKSAVRERLIELFEVVGTDDPRVAAARRRLANLLY
ncbi:tetratricopeptide repeat protein [Agromyces aerolatus]|uniref:tetratricopeptide repeat protein n=1 Tax=Agromyces sp. LY-1074 TaxID=3074080 RepID=UPI0028589F84|nr:MULTISPECIES: tetratricopeptide repeat protein [unclassified Agromyces]MDR5699920.1 tetratricopeptide repeat protein [Agromyces sp. LY-1074]MDR5706268.1 tetratricopeptide repeat protein [Agromyces sp. LY-1358]